eukprot:906831-Prymnesium_polylepis.1
MGVTWGVAWGATWMYSACEIGMRVSIITRRSIASSCQIREGTKQGACHIREGACHIREGACHIRQVHAVSGRVRAVLERCRAACECGAARGVEQR